jgi:16S rRNA (adenine(1408)-N(1))-methyltransferase
VIGIDTCRENLHQVSRKALPNALYVIANAEALPVELSGLASHIAVNFPWGSLLTGLFTDGSKVIANLRKIARPGASLEIVLNSSAL